MVKTEVDAEGVTVCAPVPENNCGIVRGPGPQIPIVESAYRSSLAAMDPSPPSTQDMPIIKTEERPRVRRPT